MIFGSDGFRPKGWSDLDGAVVGYIASTGLDAEIPRLAREHPDVRFMPLDLPSADALIARVNEGRVDFALVSSLQAAIARNVHLNFDIGVRRRARSSSSRGCVARAATTRSRRSSMRSSRRRARAV